MLFFHRELTSLYDYMSLGIIIFPSFTVRLGKFYRVGPTGVPKVSETMNEKVSAEVEVYFELKMYPFCSSTEPPCS